MNMNTSIVSINENQIDLEAIKKAGEIIKTGGLVTMLSFGLAPLRLCFAASGRVSRFAGWLVNGVFFVFGCQSLCRHYAQNGT